MMNEMFRIPVLRWCNTAFWISPLVGRVSAVPLLRLSLKGPAKSVGLVKGRESMRKQKLLVVLALVAAAAMPAMAQSDVNTIVSTATTVWGTVATLCVTIGVFTIGYRLVRKVR